MVDRGEFDEDELQRALEQEDENYAQDSNVDPDTEYEHNMAELEGTANSNCRYHAPVRCTLSIQTLAANAWRSLVLLPTPARVQYLGGTVLLVAESHVLQHSCIAAWRVRAIDSICPLGDESHVLQHGGSVPLIVSVP